MENPNDYYCTCGYVLQLSDRKALKDHFTRCKYAKEEYLDLYGALKLIVDDLFPEQLVPAEIFFSILCDKKQGLNLSHKSSIEKNEIQEHQQVQGIIGSSSPLFGRDVISCCKCKKSLENHHHEMFFAECMCVYCKPCLSE